MFKGALKETVQRTVNAILSKKNNLSLEKLFILLLNALMPLFETMSIFL